MRSPGASFFFHQDRAAIGLREDLKQSIQNLVRDPTNLNQPSKTLIDFQNAAKLVLRTNFKHTKTSSRCGAHNGRRRAIAEIQSRNHSARRGIFFFVFKAKLNWAELNAIVVMQGMWLMFLQRLAVH